MDLMMEYGMMEKNGGWMMMLLKNKITGSHVELSDGLSSVIRGLESGILNNRKKFTNFTGTHCHTPIRTVQLSVQCTVPFWRVHGPIRWQGNIVC
jgi:hypothetical protein